MDLIDRQALLKQIDIDSDGEPGYYGDTWKFIDTIKSMPSATDKNVGTKLGTDLAEVGTDLATKRTVKGYPIDADLLMLKVEEEYGFRTRDRLYELIRTMPKYELPPAQPNRGKWVLVCDNNGMHFICNKCGAWRYHQEQKFCGECGADMREVTT